MKFLAASVLVLGLTVSSSLDPTITQATTTTSRITENCPSYGRWFSKYCGSGSCSREPNKEEKDRFCVDFVTHQNCGRDPYAQWLINAKYGCGHTSLPCCLGATQPTSTRAGSNPGRKTIRINGGGKRGRLELLVDGTWGSVCSEWFHKWSAVVACRQLGYSVSNLNSISFRKISNGAGPPGVAMIRDCVGHEDLLQNCRGVFGRPGCWGVLELDCGGGFTPKDKYFRPLDDLSIPICEASICTKASRVPKPNVSIMTCESDPCTPSQCCEGAIHLSNHTTVASDVAPDGEGAASDASTTTAVRAPAIQDGATTTSVGAMLFAPLIYLLA